VLFEMLTGTRPFDGEDTTAVLARIIERQPDWRVLPPATVAVRPLIAHCLRKDPAQRLHDIADVRIQIEDILNDPAGSATVVVPGRNYREWLAWSTAVLLLGVVLFLALRPSTTSSSGDSVTFPVFPPEKTAFSPAINTTVNIPAFALSPDGKALAFVAATPGAGPMLWVRALDQMYARQLAGTEDAQDPIWSPDSRWIGFFADGKLKKVPAGGGAVQVISQNAYDARGGTWGPEDTILFSSGTEPIQRVSSTGGKTTPVTVIDAARQEATHRFPQILPDGHHFLYSVLGIRPDQSGVYVGSLDGKTKRLLVAVNTSAVYAPPGYLLFVEGDTLLGQDFDATHLELKGQPFLVAEHVGKNTAFMSAVSVSRTGTIAYGSTLSQNGRLVWIDRAGNPLGPTGTTEGDYADFRLSPDETRLAAALHDPRSNAVEVWLTDLARGSTSRLATGALISASPLWSPDGTRLVFRSNRNGIIEFYERSAAGGGNNRPVLSLETYRTVHLSQNLVPTDWSRNDNIVFSAPAPTSGSDLWLLPLGRDEKPSRFIAASAADKLHGNFSPDAHSVAYTSNESGKFEVYVETVPQSDRKWPVSTNGGYEPRWRADGREIYFLSEDRKLMTVPVGPGPSFGVPKALFQTRVPAGVTANRTHYVPSRDGQRFLVNMATDAVASPITVVVNWTASLKK
jgi:Tol biopolymer transport system component